MMDYTLTSSEDNYFYKENEISRKPNYFKTESVIHKRIIKPLFLCLLHQLFTELFHMIYKDTESTFFTEYYIMDANIIQFLIREIIDTDEYTLEGIAYYTRIPFDIILEASYGKCQQLSATSWIRVAELYLQVKPEVLETLLDRILEFKDKNRSALSLISG